MNFQLIKDLLKENGLFALSVAFLLFFLSLLILVTPFYGLVAWAHGVSMDEFQAVVGGEIGDERSYLSLLWWAQGGANILSWLVPGLIMAWLLGGPRSALSLERSPSLWSYLLLILLFLACLPLVQIFTFSPESFHLPSWMSGIEADMHALEEKAEAVVTYLVARPDISSLLINMLIFAVIPAFGEEVFFRGIIQQRLGKNRNPHMAIWVTAFIFSLMHFQAYGFFARMILGAILGYLLYYSGSLWPSIIGHFLYNAFSLLGVWLAVRYGVIDEAFLENNLEIPPLIGLLSVILFVGIFWGYKRKVQGMQGFNR